MFSLPANPAGTKRSLLRTHPPPPALDLARARPREAALASGGAPKIRVGDVAVPDHDDNEGETLQLSSSSSSSDSESESPSPPLHTHGDRTGLGKSSSKSTLAPLRSSSRTSSRSSSRTRSADDKNDSALPEDITKDLAALQQLRRSVKTNLRLRPIRSRSNLPKMNLNLDIEGVIPPAPLPLSVREGEGIPTRGNGIYPTINTTAINTANPPPLSASSPASSAYYTPTAETPHTAFFSARNPRAPFDYTPLPIPLLQPTNLANPIAPGELADRLQALRRPLLLDTRPSKLYSQVRLKGSVNVVLPLARRRLESLDELREYVTTQDGKTRWDALIGGGSQWDGGLVVINDGETDDVHASLIAALQVPRVPMAYLSGSLYSLPLEPFIVTEPTGTPQHAMLFAIKNRGTPLSSPLPPLPANIASPISARGLYNRLTAPSRPLLIDTRPLAAHQAFHLRDSVSIAIPSLILKRCRKPGGGLPSLSALKQFATTEQGKAHWDILMGVDGGWDGNVVIYDDEMDVKDRDSPGVTAWAIMPVISPLLKSDGRIEYLEGGLARAGHDPDLGTLVVTGDEVEAAPSRTGTPRSGGFAKKNGGGLFQLDTDSALKFKKLPEIDLNPSPASNPPSPLPAHAPAVQGKGLPPSPLPIMPSTSRTSSSLSPSTSVADASPSPPPSSIGFRRPPPPRRPSVPALRRLDTRSAERLVPPPPKLSLRTKPMRSATLTVPPALTLNIGGLGGPPQSPSHLQLMYSTHSPPLSARFLSPTGDPTNYLTPYYTPPHTPSTPRLGFGFYPDDPPPTARPDMDPPTTEDAFPVFTVSTILPNFLYLGPELTTPEHVKELRDLGVKRVLNIAAECDDDMGLGLRQAFRYCKIPMRDTVEEDGIAKGVSEACNFIDDARLHSAPTYVHCKAGKSRSVTAVMAYLIHANHWTLSRAYAFVLERRKGISPNIGFVSELMNFEERELGGKSVGVQPTSGINSAATGAPSGANGEGGGMQHAQATAQEAYAQAGGHRRATHVRESLPPALSLTHTTSSALYTAEGGNGPMSAASVMDKESSALGSAMSTVISPLSMRDRVLGDAGQEMEVRDENGRYRHARRAPVDETTLQPMRRVSKAGLEGGWV